MKKILFGVLLGILLFVVIVFVPIAQAATIRFALAAPQGQLQRGQNADFTIAVDTNNQTITTTTIGMTYDATLLEYVTTKPGNTFTDVQATVQSTGKIVFTGTNAAGYSGTGTFAVVTFKLIATSSGSTELCVLVSPDETTPAPTQPPQTTSPPRPTALPQTGATDQFQQGAIIGAGILLLFISGFALSYNPKKISHHKPKS